MKRGEQREKTREKGKRKRAGAAGRTEAGKAAPATETAEKAMAGKSVAEKQETAPVAKGKAEGQSKGKAKATETAPAAIALPLHELFREGEVPVLEVGITLPAGEELPPGVSAYYRSLAAAYLRAAQDRLLPAAREALLALPPERRRFGFRRYRLAVQSRTEAFRGYLLVTRAAALTCGAATRRREVCEVFRLPEGRLTPPLVFLREACGKLPRGARRFRHAEMTAPGGEAILTTARGSTLHIPLTDGAETVAETDKC